jgi:CDP-diglyceride synthetase
MFDAALLLKLLALLGIANGVPILATKLFQGRLATPIDGGLKLPDGQRLFGESKTVRGLVASVVFTTLAAPLLSLAWSLGAMLAAASMAGDLVSSFIKRRIGLKPHAPALGLDQIPEALLPLLIVGPRLGLGWVDIAILLAGFVLVGAVLSRLRFRSRAGEQSH